MDDRGHTPYPYNICPVTGRQMAARAVRGVSAQAGRPGTVSAWEGGAARPRISPTLDRVPSTRSARRALAFPAPSIAVSENKRPSAVRGPASWVKQIAYIRRN